MQIKSNFFNLNNLNPVNSFGISRTRTDDLKTDTFTKSPVSFKGTAAELAKKRYSELSEEEKDVLRREIEPYQQEVIDDCVNASELIKAVYDEKYGEGNWEYISIGRSCANIAKTLDKMGIKSYIIPISGLQEGIENGEELTTKKGFEQYRDFIYNLGLNPQTVSNSPKKYIFQDYCSSGKSIKIFEEFIRSDKMGLDKENIIFQSINNTMEESIPKLIELKKTDFNPFSFLVNRLGLQNYFGSMKAFTVTPKLPYQDLSKIETIKDETGTSFHKIFDFGICDKLNSNSMLADN